MAQRMPRNELLHERRHKRKAGAHGAPSRELTSLRATLKFLDEEYGPDAVNLILNDIRRDRVRVEGEER